MGKLQDFEQVEVALSLCQRFCECWRRLKIWLVCVERFQHHIPMLYTSKPLNCNSRSVHVIKIVIPHQRISTMGKIKHIEAETKWPPFVSKGSINNIPALVQIMAMHRMGAFSLFTRCALSYTTARLLFIKPKEVLPWDLKQSRSTSLCVNSIISLHKVWSYEVLPLGRQVATGCGDGGGGGGGGDGGLGARRWRGV